MCGAPFPKATGDTRRLPGSRRGASLVPNGVSSFVLIVASVPVTLSSPIIRHRGQRLHHSWPSRPRPRRIANPWALGPDQTKCNKLEPYSEYLTLILCRVFRQSAQDFGGKAIPPSMAGSLGRRSACVTPHNPPLSEGHLGHRTSVSVERTFQRVSPTPRMPRPVLNQGSDRCSGLPKSGASLIGVVGKETLAVGVWPAVMYLPPTADVTSCWAKLRMHGARLITLGTRCRDGVANGPMTISPSATCPHAQTTFVAEQPILLVLASPR